MHSIRFRKDLDITLLHIIRHLPTFPLSHFPTFTPSHLHTFPPSHLPTFTPLTTTPLFHHSVIPLNSPPYQGGVPDRAGWFSITTLIQSISVASRPRSKCRYRAFIPALHIHHSITPPLHYSIASARVWNQAYAGHAVKTAAYFLTIY